jgi:ABC-type uncharacterized transport system permease subunit
MLRPLFPKQIGRLSYFIRIVPYSMLNSYFEPLAQTITPGLSLHNIGLGLLALASIFYGFVYIILPRVRDADLPRTSMICVLIPIVNIAYGILLLFKRTALRPVTIHDIAPRRV